jgi:hypothetical protein
MPIVCRAEICLPLSHCHVVSQKTCSFPFPNRPTCPPTRAPSPTPCHHDPPPFHPSTFFHVLYSMCFLPLPNPSISPTPTTPISATYLPPVLLGLHCRWVSHTTMPCLVGCLLAISRLSMRFDLVPQHRVWFDSTGEEENILADCGLSSKCICPSRVAMLMRAMDSAF